MSSRLIIHTGVLVGFFALIYGALFFLPPSPALKNIEYYLPLHTIMETFSVVVSCMIFGIIWNGGDESRSRNVVLLGAAFLAVGLLDFAHLMSYKGMPDFVTPSGQQKGIAFWLAARWVAAVAMPLAAVIAWKPSIVLIDRNRMLAVFLGFTVLVYWAVLLHPQSVPVFWDDGLTPLKRFMEYGLTSMYAFSAILFYRLSLKADDHFDCRGLFLASGVMAISELCFSNYSTVTDVFNLLGHVYKVIAYLFLYQVLFKQLVRDPYVKLERSRHDIWLEKERAEVTLHSIMDGVITTDANGCIVSMNPVAWQLTGWSSQSAQGLPLSRVFNVFDETDNSPIENPVERCLREKRAVLLSNHAMIVSAFGETHSIEQLASPIVSKKGDIIGVVMVFRDVTERRYAQDELRRKERGLSEAQAIAHLGSFEWDLVSNQQIWTEELFRIFGFLPGSIEPTHELFMFLLHPDDRERVLESLDQVIQAIEAYDAEYRIVHADGTIRHVYSIGEVQCDQLGKPVTMIGTVQDITAHKQAEELLQKTKAEVEDLYDYAPCGYHSLDSEGVIQRVNQTELDWLGYSREEMVGKKRFTDLLSADSVKTFYENYPHFKRNGFVRDLEYEMLRKDGSQFMVSLSATAIYDPDGNFLASRSTIYDITERKKVKRALIEKEESLKKAQAIAHLGSWEWEIGGNQQSWSDESFRILGFQPGEIEADYQSFLNRVLPEDRQTVIGKVGSALDTRSAYHCEFRIQRPNGEIRHILGQGEVVLDQAGEPIRMIGINLDITESWQHKNEIEAINQQLEQRVAQRTSQLEAANKELEAFSYSVSHDLRAPLRAIDGFSQILAADYGPSMEETARRHLERILRAASRMGELIDDLLQLSRVSRDDIQFTPVNLSWVVSDILTELAHRQPERKTLFKIAPDQLAQGDTHLLKIALENLLANAWKFTRDREVTEIEFGIIQNAEKKIYFVRDNGVGFNPKYVHKLFGAFQRLHSEDEFEGTGIGLATVQRIISRHGGAVWAESTLGEGAAFFFSL